MRITIMALALLLSLPVVAELRLLSDPTEPGSLAPTWTVLADGRAVLSWLARVDDGHAFRFSAYDGEGFGPATEIARGADWFANWADMPGLFELESGTWLAHWLVKSGPGTYAYDVVMAVSDDQGRRWSSPFSPHDDGTQTEHGFVSYFADGPGRAGVVWLDGRDTAGAESSDAHQHHHAHHGHGNAAMTLRAAIVDAGGQVLESVLLDERVCDCCPTAAANSAAGPVVIYRGRSIDEVRDIRILRRVDSAWTEPAALHEDGWRIPACPVNGPALIARDQQLVAAWFTLADDRPRVQLSLSSDAGERFSMPISLGEGTALGRVDLVWWRDGFALSWLDQHGGEAVLQLAHFSADGEPRWQHELARLDSGRVSGMPRLASPDGERLLLTWTESDPEHRSRVRVAEWVSADPAISPPESNP